MGNDTTPKKVAKPSSARSTPSKALRSANVSFDKDLLFLWACCQSANMQLDYAVLGQNLGLKPNATRMRYTRLKAKIEAMESEQKESANTDPECNKEPEGSSHEVKEEKGDEIEANQF
ncbi:uncharacterized protein N7511_006997 [Penicillium nucicola]|uniref:uncharacterized protein n=1 Tax=Penicillium nucicola TaxID=1850975 RepID=UPI0025451C4A|nr:uncharacterized protein N7511_006997 [Penicillium nucicola]KAJ5758303.1 hypothetical protein N7511_006997 [Penicillium nucicola]